MRSECEAEFSKPCAGVVTKRRGRLAAPMYDGRRTMYYLLIMCALRKFFRIINAC